MGFVACTCRGGAGGLPQLLWWLQVHDHCSPDFRHLRICAGGLVTTAPEGHQMTAFPVETVPGVLPTVHSVSLCRWHHRMHPTVDSSWEGIPQPKHLSQQELSSSGCLSLKLSSGTEGFYSNNSGAGPAPDRQRQHRAKKRPTKCVKAGLEQKCLQVVKKYKRCWIAKAILRKKNEAGGIRLPDFRLYYRTTVIKSMALNKNKYRSMEQHRKFRNNTQAPVVT